MGVRKHGAELKSPFIKTSPSRTVPERLATPPQPPQPPGWQWHSSPRPGPANSPPPTHTPPTNTTSTTTMTTGLSHLTTPKQKHNRPTRSHHALPNGVVVVRQALAQQEVEGGVQLRVTKLARQRAQQDAGACGGYGWVERRGEGTRRKWGVGGVAPGAGMREVGGRRGKSNVWLAGVGGGGGTQVRMPRRQKREHTHTHPHPHLARKFSASPKALTQPGNARLRCVALNPCPQSLSHRPRVLLRSLRQPQRGGGAHVGVRRAQVLQQGGDKGGRQRAAGLLPQLLRHLQERGRGLQGREFVGCCVRGEAEGGRGCREVGLWVVRAGGEGGQRRGFTGCARGRVGMRRAGGAGQADGRLVGG